ncbi:hypothetical protein OkiPb01528_01110 [Escherichia coli]
MQLCRQWAGGAVRQAAHHRLYHRIQPPTSSGRYNTDWMVRQKDLLYSAPLGLNCRLLAMRGGIAGGIPLMAGFGLVGLIHYKYDPMLVGKYNLSIKMLIHRQSAIIGFDNPEYQIHFGKDVTIEGGVFFVSLIAFTHPWQINNH